MQPKREQKVSASQREQRSPLTPAVRADNPQCARPSDAQMIINLASGSETMLCEGWVTFLGTHESEVKMPER